MNTISIDERTNQPRPMLYAFSNYLWLIILAIFFLCYTHTKHFHEVPIIKSFNGLKKWNSSSNPHILGLVSDLHLSHFFPETIRNTESILNILNETGVEKILISGDISDNFATNTSIKHGQQYEEDFLLCSKIFNKYKSDLFIIASGNHDEFGIEDYNSPNHYIIKHINFYRKNDIYKNYDNFLISKIQYGEDDVEILIMNPYRYPTIRAGLGYFMNLDKQMLDKIEKVVLTPTKARTRILLTHFPLSYSNTWIKSTSQKRLIDIITSNNITAIIAGHTHEEFVIHRKTSLEIQSISVKGGMKKGGAYRYISIDNGLISSEGFRLIDQKPVAVLTHPIQKKYLSDMTDFSYHNFIDSEIRVVHFSENRNLNISVSCSSKINDYDDIKVDFLKFQRIIRPNESLYSLPLKQLCNRDNFNNNVTNEYHLDFGGDWNYSADFVFGDSVKLDKESICKDVIIRKGIVAIGTICWIIIIFIWLPIEPSKYFYHLNNWITDYDETKNNIEINLFDIEMAAIFGFIVMKSRIYYNIPSFIRYFYFILVLAPFFIPISIMRIGEKSYGFIFFCGYYLKAFKLDIWGSMLTSYYVIFVLLTSTIIFSSISYLNETKKWQFVFIFDILTFISQFLLLKIAIFDILYQSTSLIYALTSPIFVFSPISIIFMEIFLFIKFLKNLKIEKREIEHNSILV